jgi:hypothetical protein
MLPLFLCVLLSSSCPLAVFGPSFLLFSLWTFFLSLSSFFLSAYMVFSCSFSLRALVGVCLLAGGFSQYDFCGASHTSFPPRAGPFPSLDASSFVSPHCKEWLRVPACCPDSFGQRIVGIDRPSVDGAVRHSDGGSLNTSKWAQSHVKKNRLDPQRPLSFDVFASLWDFVCGQIKAAGGSFSPCSILPPDNNPFNEFRRRIFHRVKNLPLDLDPCFQRNAEFFGVLGCPMEGGSYRGDVGRCFYFCAALCEAAVALAVFVDPRQSALLRSLAVCFNFVYRTSLDPAAPFADLSCVLGDFCLAFGRFDAVLFSSVVLGRSELVFLDCPPDLSSDGYPSFVFDAISHPDCFRRCSLAVHGLSDSFRLAFDRLSDAILHFRASLCEFGVDLLRMPISLSNFPAFSLSDDLIDLLNSSDRAARNESRQILNAILLFSRREHTFFDLSPSVDDSAASPSADKCVDSQIDSWWGKSPLEPHSLARLDPLAAPSTAIRSSLAAPVIKGAEGASGSDSVELEPAVSIQMPHDEGAFAVKSRESGETPPSVGETPLPVYDASLPIIPVPGDPVVLTSAPEFLGAACPAVVSALPGRGVPDGSGVPTFDDDSSVQGV